MNFQTIDIITKNILSINEWIEKYPSKTPELILIPYKESTKLAISTSLQELVNFNEALEKVKQFTIPNLNQEFRLPSVEEAFQIYKTYHLGLRDILKQFKIDWDYANIWTGNEDLDSVTCNYRAFSCNIDSGTIRNVSKNCYFHILPIFKTEILYVKISTESI